MTKQLVICFTLCSLLLASCKNESVAFQQPNDTEWATYTTVVNEYMYYRTQAVLQQDITMLLAAFPALRKNEQPDLGINHVHIPSETYIDANYDLEYYDRLTVQHVSTSNVIVRIHGLITYTRSDFDISGGEIILDLTLQKQRGHWLVMQTDEVTDGEYHDYIR